jgi:hypothetical protein
MCEKLPHFFWPFFFFTKQLPCCWTHKRVEFFWALRRDCTSFYMGHGLKRQDSWVRYQATTPTSCSFTPHPLVRHPHPGTNRGLVWFSLCGRRALVTQRLSRTRKWKGRVFPSSDVFWYARSEPPFCRASNHPYEVSHIPIGAFLSV